MKQNLTLTVTGVLAAFSLATFLFAASPPAQQASNLLNRLHDNAFKVRDWADQLQAYDRVPTLVSWEMDADALDHMRTHINRMDRILHRLQTMEGSLPQDQRLEINQIAPPMIELTNTTQIAIQFMRNHEDLIFLPKYTAYLDQMFSEASRVERDSGTRPGRA